MSERETLTYVIREECGKKGLSNIILLGGTHAPNYTALRHSIIRRLDSLGYYHREIAASLRISRSTVSSVFYHDRKCKIVKEKS